MDWYVVDVDKNVLFDLTTPDGTRIVTIAGVPYLPILGMNSHGLAYVGNSRVLQRQSPRRAQRLRAPLGARGALHGRSRRARLHAHAGARLQPPARRPRRAHLERRDVRLRRRHDGHSIGRRAHQPLRRARNERLRGLPPRGVAHRGSHEAERRLAARAAGGRGPAAPRRGRAAQSRQRAAVHLRAPRPRRRAGRSGDDGGEHDLRPRRHAAARLRRAPRARTSTRRSLRGRHEPVARPRHERRPHRRRLRQPLVPRRRRRARRHDQSRSRRAGHAGAATGHRRRGTATSRRASSTRTRTPTCRSCSILAPTRRCAKA